MDFLKHVEDNHTEQVQGMLDARADANFADPSQGLTALMIASSLGFQDISQLLLQTESINIDQSDADGETALTMAVEEGQFAMVKLLYTKQM